MSETPPSVTDEVIFDADEEMNSPDSFKGALESVNNISGVNVRADESFAGRFLLSTDREILIDPHMRVLSLENGLLKIDNIS